MTAQFGSPSHLGQAVIKKSFNKRSCRILVGCVPQAPHISKQIKAAPRSFFGRNMCRQRGSAAQRRGAAAAPSLLLSACQVSGDGGSWGDGEGVTLPRHRTSCRPGGTRHYQTGLTEHRSSRHVTRLVTSQVDIMCDLARRARVRQSEWLGSRVQL